MKMAKIKETTKIGSKEYKIPVYDIKELEIKPKRKRKKKEKEQEQKIIQPPPLNIDPSMLQAKEQLSPEQATAIVMQFMGNMDKIAMHTELTDDRIVNIMAIQSIGDQYDIDLLKSDIPNRLLPLLVSKDRKGRNEIIQLIKAWSSGKASQGLLDRLRGGVF